MSSEGGKATIFAALGANIGIAVLKFVAFLLTRSSSMLAESIHSLADSGNQVLLLRGGHKAKKEATPQHPFGFGRERYVYGFLVSIIIFSLGGLFALYEAYEKWHEVHAGHPDKLLEGKWWWVPLVVLGGSILLEGFSFRTAMNEGNASRGTRSWPQFIRSAKEPEVPVVLLEDFAALVGLTFALLGVGLTLLTRNGLFDAMGSGLIGVLLICVALVLATEMKSLLVGEAATPAHTEAIEDALAGAPGVERIIHMKTLHMGPQELLVAAKLAVARGADAAQIADTINAAEDRARAAVSDLTLLMYLEPDIDLGEGYEGRIQSTPAQPHHR